MEDPRFTKTIYTLLKQNRKLTKSCIKNLLVFLLKTKAYTSFVGRMTMDRWANSCFDKYEVDSDLIVIDQFRECNLYAIFEYAFKWGSTHFISKHFNDMLESESGYDKWVEISDRWENLVRGVGSARLSSSRIYKF